MEKSPEYDFQKTSHLSLPLKFFSHLEYIAFREQFPADSIWSCFCAVYNISKQIIPFFSDYTLQKVPLLFGNQDLLKENMIWFSVAFRVMRECDYHKNICICHKSIVITKCSKYILV